MFNMYKQRSLKVARIADEIAKSSEHGLPHFLDPCEIFHALLKRVRWISSTADDTAATPAMNHGPHLFGPQCPPAAVRAGTDGIERDMNDFSFLSWSAKVVSKSARPSSSACQLAYGKRWVARPQETLSA